MAQRKLLYANSKYMLSIGGGLIVMMCCGEIKLLQWHNLVSGMCLMQADSHFGLLTINDNPTRNSCQMFWTL